MEQKGFMKLENEGLSFILINRSMSKKIHEYINVSPKKMFSYIYLSQTFMQFASINGILYCIPQILEQPGFGVLFQKMVLVLLCLFL